MLQRMPRGFAPDHPAGDWLRYQSFTAGHALTEAQLGSRKLIDILAARLRTHAAAGALDQQRERAARGDQPLKER